MAVEQANVAGVREVDAATVKGWLTRGEAVLIDVREPDEHAREWISGSKLVPLSRFDAASVPRSSGTRVVLHCRSGVRSVEAGARFVAAGKGSGDCEAFSLKGGIEAWKAAGLEVQRNTKVPISIMRQVQITVGTGVLIGSVLAATVSPWFLILTGFFGAGLFFAGVTGMCGLAAVLSRMPWNKGLRCQKVRA